MDTNFKVIDAMTKSPITISPDISVQECAELMKSKNVGSLLVMEDKNLVGIITEQDIVRKAVAPNKNLVETNAKNIMAVNISTIEPHVDLFEAISSMAQLDIRHLPVIDDGEFVGLLTAKDILKIEPALFEIMVDSFEIKREPHKPLYEEESYYGDTDDDEE